MFETWYKMAALLQSGLNIRPVITHRLPYTEYQQAFEIMGRGQSGKVVMDWEKVKACRSGFSPTPARKSGCSPTYSTAHGQ